MAAYGTSASAAPPEALASCPVETTLSVIGGKWKPLILYQLRSGPRRFNELRRQMPEVTQRMLTAHLRELEQDGAIHRRVFPVVPPHVEYSLTDLGRSLVPILEAMAGWGTAYQDRVAAASRSGDAG